MTTTVVGVFDEYDEALRAREKLFDAGIDERSVHISTGRSDEQRAQQAARRDRRGFFARLFGMRDDDDLPGHYAEAVRRGGTAVAVALEDNASLDLVSGIMNECGAIDLDERVERWKKGGYAGFDPTAPAFGDEDIRRGRFPVAPEDNDAGNRAVPGDCVRVHRH